jgi:hypothetical protein
MNPSRIVRGFERISVLCRALLAKDGAALFGVVWFQQAAQSVRMQV